MRNGAGFINGRVNRAPAFEATLGPLSRVVEIWSGAACESLAAPEIFQPPRISGWDLWRLVATHPAWHG